MEAGLAVCEDTYHTSQFNHIAYHSSAFSGQLYNADSMARVSYYNATALPEVDFDAQQEIVGAPSDAVDGHYYMPIIDAHLTQSVPMSVAVPSVSFASGPNAASVQVTVSLFGELTSIASTYIRVAVCEDVTFGGELYRNVVRDMVPTPTGTPLTIQHNGEVQTVNLNFTMGSWVPANMHVIAFVQRDTDKYIYNSGSSLNVPYYATAGVEGPQQMLAFGEPLVFGNTTVLNYGLESDTYDITIDNSGLPPGWDAYFTHDGVNTTSVTVTLDPFEGTQFFVTMLPTGAGNGRARINVYSHGAGTILTHVDFLAVNGNADVLVVADDGGNSYAEDFYAGAVEHAGKSAALWDVTFSPVDGATLNYFDAVIWECGNEEPGIKPADRATIDTYLGQGGHLLVTGQDVIQNLQAEGSAARIWFQSKFRISFASGSSGSMAINGTAGDEIGDGLSFSISGGDGAGNQTDPDVFNLLSVDPAIAVFRYGTGTIGGTRVEYNGYRAMLLGFGFEGIATQAMRDEVMERSLNWLIGTDLTPAPEAPRVLSLAQNSPNPFNPQTKIAFALDQTGPVQLAVYDLQGRLVRTLASETLPAGAHEVIWDGRTDGGQQAASGTYVYRLTADGRTLSSKMSLVK